MAQVPVLQQQARNRLSQRTAMPGVRATNPTSAETFGAGAGRALQQAAGQMDAYAQAMEQEREQEQIKADRAAAKDAHLQLMDAETVMLDAFTQKAGREAFDGRDAAIKAFRDKQSELEKSLGTEQARQFFRDTAAPRARHVERTFYRHARKSMTVWEGQQNVAAQAKYADDALQHGIVDGRVMPEDIGRYKGLGKLEIMEQAAREGWPPEMLAQAVEEYQSGIDRAVIARLIASGDVQQASAYYKANKDGISGAHRGAIEAALKDETEKVEAIEAADGLWRGAAADEGEATAADKFQNAMNEVERISDPIKQQKVRNNILQRFRTEKMIEKQQEEEYADQAEAWVFAGKDPNNLPLDVKIGVGLAKMTAYQNIFDQGGELKTNRDGYEFMDSLITDDVEEVAKKDVRAQVGNLSRADRAYAMKHINAARDALRGGSGEYNSRNTQAMGYFKDILAASGITNKADRGRLTTLFTKALDEESDGGKSFVTFSRAQEIADSIGTTIAKDGLVHGTNEAPLHAIHTIGDIPDEVQEAIREVAGPGASDAEIFNIYMIGWMRGRVHWREGSAE